MPGCKETLEREQQILICWNHTKPADVKIKLPSPFVTALDRIPYQYPKVGQEFLWESRRIFSIKLHDPATPGCLWKVQHIVGAAGTKLPIKM